MAQFVAATLESVQRQDYPEWEHIIVDGGSTDGTLDRIRAYASLHPGRVKLLTGPDGGPAEAIQKGLHAATGEIFGYLNADDTLELGALGAAARTLMDHAEYAAVYGNAFWMDERGERIGPYPVEPFDADSLARACYICQPACFVRTEALRHSGGMDLNYQVAFDYELWLRLSRSHRFLHIDGVLANSRVYRENKTFRQRALGLREACRALRLHRGYVPFGWAHTYASFLLDRRDLFFEPLRPTFTKYLFSLFTGTYLNWRSPLRFWKEWYGVMSFDALARRWSDSWVSRHLGMRPR